MQENMNVVVEAIRFQLAPEINPVTDTRRFDVPLECPVGISTADMRNSEGRAFYECANMLVSRDGRIRSITLNGVDMLEVTLGTKAIYTGDCQQITGDLVALINDCLRPAVVRFAQIFSLGDDISREPKRVPLW